MATFERKHENAVIDELDRLMDQRKKVTLARRQVIAMLGTAGAGVGMAALTGCDGTGMPVLNAITPSVTDVLNFALNLEYLEASFYLYVATGTGLSSADMGTGAGTVTGAPSKITFTSSLSAVITSAAAQLALDEKEHVEFLRTTIAAVGGTPVSMPNINLSANGAVTNDATFLAAARQFENVGVSAYGGGAQFLVSSVPALTYAAQILDTEGQHAGLVRQLCIALSVTSPAVDGLDNPPTAAKYFDTSSTTGLAPIRTPSQVMQILYAVPGQTGITQGGFFPNGLNGSIRST